MGVVVLALFTPAGTLSYRTILKGASTRLTDAVGLAWQSVGGE